MRSLEEGGSAFINKGDGALTHGRWESTADQGNTWLTWCNRHILTNGPGIEAKGARTSGG
jgi:hypothetical protein